MARASSEFDDLPREHVLRPILPWRVGSLTECGRDSDEGTLTRDELVAKVRKQGPSRAKLTTCLTCFETAQRWPGWEANPAAVMAREVKGVSYWTGHEGAEINDELRAIAMLIAEHRDEFDETLAALRQAVPFKPRRRAAARSTKRL